MSSKVSWICEACGREWSGKPRAERTATPRCPNDPCKSRRVRQTEEPEGSRGLRSKIEDAEDPFADVEVAPAVVRVDYKDSRRTIEVPEFGEPFREKIKKRLSPQQAKELRKRSEEGARSIHRLIYNLLVLGANLFFNQNWTPPTDSEVDEGAAAYLNTQDFTSGAVGITEKLPIMGVIIVNGNFLLKRIQEGRRKPEVTTKLEETEIGYTPPTKEERDRGSSPFSSKMGQGE